jgi:type IX secretion system PorP/SprF family membrane protein
MSISAYAQDFHLSQYEASPMYFNPAMTGHFDGDLRVSLHYRNQWRQISSKAFTTTALSVDMPVKKVENLKIGMFILNNRAGAGNFNALNAVFSGSYDYKFNNPHHRVSAGLQLGMIHKSVNIQGLIFDEQYNPSNGGSFNPNEYIGEDLSRQGIVMPALNSGLMYYYASDVSRFNPFFGISSFNLTSPKESFFGEENRLPRRYMMHGGTKYNATSKLQISWFYMLMRQTNARELTTGLMAYYYLKNSDTYIMYGNTYRNRDAVMIHFGLKYRDFTYRFSYDVNTSTLSPYTGGRGAFEMSIVYLIKNIEPNPIKSCPRL